VKTERCGRFNLYDLVATPRSSATASPNTSRSWRGDHWITGLCRVASEDLRLRTLKALTTKTTLRAASVENPIVFVGPSQVAGRDGWLFELA